MSFDQSLIIYKFPVLFNILNEIKSNFNFNIEYFDNDQFKNNPNNRNLVVISRIKIKDIHNQVKIDEFPIN